jgi:hypothetical protein
LTDHVNGADNKENFNGIAADDDEPVTDSKFVKEIEELAKMKDSGAAKVILEDLKKKQHEKCALDPRSASRTPSAAAEPPYKPRYDSPLFACKYQLRCIFCIAWRFFSFFLVRNYRINHVVSSVRDLSSIHFCFLSFKLVWLEELFHCLMPSNTNCSKTCN